MRQCTQKLIRFLRHPRCQHIGLVFSEPLQLVEEGQFLLLFLWVLLDLAFLTSNLGLEDLPFTLGRQKSSRTHGKRAGQHACQAAHQYEMAISGTCITCHTTYNAKDRAQTVVRSIDGVTEPAAAAFMPAFAAQHHIQHTLRPNGTDRLTNYTPMALFLAPYLAQHALSLSIVDAVRLGLVARNIF